MKRTSSVTTEIVRSPSSRRPRDRATVRAQFESWLTEIAQDIDNERGERLRELVERSQLTQRKLADEVGVESRTVQRWLRGGGIAAENRQPLADALGRSVAYIMHGELEGPDPHDILARLDRIEERLAEISERLTLDPRAGSGAMVSELIRALERERNATVHAPERLIPGGRSADTNT
jgi:transcriptional regulator with XRE-family HTH domain